MFGRSLIIALLAAIAPIFLFVSPAFANGFDSWAAVIVAGDAHAHSGAPSEVFDNGRRDIAKALMAIGFAQSHILQFSTQPAKDTESHPGNADTDAIYSGFKRLAQQASGGCFVYFTSHGAQSGILVGNTLVTPRAIAQLVDDSCADKMTVVFVSACYSGVFIPALQRDTRMIVTAARKDRTSFGCGEANQYTFFDECVVKSLPAAPSFPGLATRVQSCVAEREKEEMATPPSEPQVSIGAVVAGSLATAYAFSAN
jgi:peptidase C13-like protein